jgi:hypothetical protein
MSIFCKWLCSFVPPNRLAVFPKKVLAPVNSTVILEACARLHNFVIDQDSEDDFEEDDEDDEGNDVVHYQTILDLISMNGSPLGWAYLPTIEPLVAIEGTSRTRDAILAHISRNGYRRPAENVERRLQELHELQPPLM